LATERELFAHFEAHLGPLQTRFTLPSEPSLMPCQYLRFDDTPLAGASTILTLGLSRHTLLQPSGRPVRQELLMSAYSQTVTPPLVGAMDVIARELDERHRPLLRGQLIGPRGSVLPETCIEAFIAMNPWYWDDEFSYFDGVDPPVYVVWLIPITRSEAEYVRRQGIGAFESLIEEQDPDLLDLYRNSMSL
jgi:hypothetical protein